MDVQFVGSLPLTKNMQLLTLSIHIGLTVFR